MIQLDRKKIQEGGLYHCIGITGREFTLKIITKMEWLISRWIIFTAECIQWNHDRIKVWLKEKWKGATSFMFWRNHTMNGCLIVIIGPPLDHMTNIDQKGAHDERLPYSNHWSTVGSYDQY